jgi:predicted nucleic acid-binding protein
MVAFVPDASLTLTWCFEDEATPKTDALLYGLKQGEEATVPAHWAVEVANGLLMAVRRNRISEEKATRFVQDLTSLPIQIDPESTLQIFSRVFALAQQHRLTAYDAAYLEIAMRAGVPLASLDDDLRKAAVAVGAALT